jgi:hypothetical protein
MKIRTGAFAVLVAAIVPLLLAYLGVAAPASASTGSTAKTYVVVVKGTKRRASRPSSRRGAGPAERYRRA